MDSQAIFDFKLHRIFITIKILTKYSDDNSCLYPYLLSVYPNICAIQYLHGVLFSSYYNCKDRNNKSRKRVKQEAVMNYLILTSYFNLIV